MTVVFVHGAGSAGRLAWPDQAAAPESDWVFLDRSPEGDDPGRDADRILDLLRGTSRGHVVAHSYGANAALLAAQRRPALVHTLTLLEPACFDLARGGSAVEEHIEAMAPVFAVADDPTVSAREFSLRFAAGMGFEPPVVPDEELEILVSRLRALRPPWDTGLAVEDVAAPSLVITGGWSALYDQTARALAALGAHHVELAGAGHRVQDDPRSSGLMREHWGDSR